MITRLARQYITQSPWPFLLAVILCTLGVASAILIFWLQNTLESHAQRQAQGIDLVVGAKGSGLQNTLAAVYHADIPNGNITLAAVNTLAAHPMIARAEPISLGDSVAGARIVGAKMGFFSLYDATPASGALPQQPFDAVIGANVAKRTKLAIGERFVGSHGMAAGGETHDTYPYTVVGILAPTGRVIDELVVTPLESVWLAHEGHTAATEPEVTFALITLKSPVAMATLPRWINSQTSLQASSPASESARLLANFGWVAVIVKTFAMALIASAMIATFAALAQALERRQTDIAVMRAMGVSRKTIARWLCLEALAVVLVAFAIALLVVVLATFWLTQSALPGLQLVWSNGLVIALASLAITVGLALVASLPTLIRAYRIDVAAQLSRA
jgi:putative ABC transport system permease protein